MLSVFLFWYVNSPMLKKIIHIESGREINNSYLLDFRVCVWTTRPLGGLQVLCDEIILHPSHMGPFQLEVISIYSNSMEL